MIAPVLRGHLYPSNLHSRCPRFHACIATKKCQNFDCHRLDCQLCESLVRPNELVGGYLPEGEFVPDVQHALKILEVEKKIAWSSPDGQPNTQRGDQITAQYEQQRRATEVLSRFSGKTNMQIQQEIAKDENAPYRGKVV